MSGSESNNSFANVVINSSKRKRVQTPSPAKQVGSSTVNCANKETQSVQHDHDDHVRRFTVRKRSNQAVAKSKATVAMIPPPIFDDDLPISVGCQTILSQTIMEENKLIEYYINLANKERRAFNKERRDKHKVLDVLEKESQVTEMLTRSITECLQIGETGLIRVRELDNAFPKWSLAGNLSQAEVNAKILCEVEKHKRSTLEYQFIVRNIVTKIGETMNEFEKIKDLNVETPSPNVSAYVPDFNQSNSTLLSQLLSSNSTSTASQIATRHSARTPARMSNRSVKSRAVKFSSPLNKFLAKETIELEVVNPVSTIEFDAPKTPARVNKVPQHSFSKKANFAEVNSRDINLDKCNISQEVKTENEVDDSFIIPDDYKKSSTPQGIKSSQVVLNEIIGDQSTDESEWHDLELEDFSEDWLKSQEANAKREWEAFCKTEAPSDTDK